MNRRSIAFDPLFPSVGRLPQSIFPGQLGVVALLFRVVAAIHDNIVWLVTMSVVLCRIVSLRVVSVRVASYCCDSRRPVSLRFGFFRFVVRV